MRQPHRFPAHLALHRSRHLHNTLSLLPQDLNGTFPLIQLCVASCDCGDTIPVTHMFSEVLFALRLIFRHLLCGQFLTLTDCPTSALDQIIPHKNHNFKANPNPTNKTHPKPNYNPSVYLIINKARIKYQVSGMFH